MAQADDDDFGILTLLVQLDFQRAAVQDSFRLLFPAPDVDSACVCLVRREQPLLPTTCAKPSKKLSNGRFRSAVK